MPFKLPEQTFDASEHAKNKVLRANQLEEIIIQQFKSAYEDFWGVTENSGSRYPTEQMQQVLEAMPIQTAIDILTNAASLVAYIDKSNPEALPE